MGEAHQRVHHGDLPRVIQLETGYPPSVGKNRGLGEFAQLAAIDECFHPVLLDVVVVVDDLRHAVAELREVPDVLMDAVVVDVVGSRLRSQQAVVVDILLGKAVPVVAADHRVGQVEIFDHRLQFAFVLPGHFAAKDRGDLPGLPDVAVQVQ